MTETLHLKSGQVVAWTGPNKGRPPKFTDFNFFAQMVDWLMDERPAHPQDIADARAEVSRARIARQSGLFG